MPLLKIGTKVKFQRPSTGAWVEGRVQHILPPLREGDERQIKIKESCTATFPDFPGRGVLVDENLVKVDEPQIREEYYKAHIIPLWKQERKLSPTHTNELIDWFFRHDQVDSHKVIFKLTDTYMGAGFRKAVCDKDIPWSENPYLERIAMHAHSIEELRLADSGFNTDMLCYFRKCRNLKLVDIRGCPSPSGDPIDHWLGDDEDECELPWFDTLLCNEVRECM